MKNVDAPTTALLAACFEHGLIARDPAAFRASMEAAGFLKPEAAVADDVVYRLVAQPWQQMLSSEPTRMAFPRTDMKRGQDKSDEERTLDRAFNLPTPFVILMRTFVGLQALVARLGAERAWRPIAEQIWPVVSGPPTTRLGELEAEWLADRNYDASLTPSTPA